MNPETDKSKKLKTSISLLNDKLHFEGSVSGTQPVHIDYTPPLGDNLGYTSLELLLLSLSSCLGSSALTFLRRMNKTIHDFRIESTGMRKQEHPTGFSSIEMKLIVKSPDLQKADLDKVVKLSEETYCPVWSMIKGNVDVSILYEISRN
ncbi:MAG TPA: OsmC family protein [Bacteroidales bacterium]|jgi:putative redox protein|nr:OsmC family protein [Bacteroidales bacterium]